MDRTNTQEIIRLQKQIRELQDKLTHEKKEKLELVKLLYETYTREEKILHEYAFIKDKYSALKTSKLGKLTIKYWKLKSGR